MRSIQANETDTGRFVFIFVSNLGLGGPYAIILFYHLVTDSLRGRSFYFVLFLCFDLFVMSITKMAYAEPRIFWWAYDINPDECTSEYGNPSGHTELAIAYPLLWYLDIFETRRRNEKVEGRTSIG
jgi:hypothetical protein